MIADERQSNRTFPSAALSQAASFHTWYWALISLLALFAYARALGIGFLSDDFLLLYVARSAPGVDLGAFLPAPNWTFYRPVGSLLTWQLGWQVWGFNPLPYHLLGLLAHTATSLVLGLWLAEVSGRRGLGWLAGALFAVFPLHIEAVGWLAAQWDVWAALFGLLSLWLFTKWWLSANAGHYALSIIFFGLGIFSKESLFTWVLIYPLSVWLVGPKFDAKAWRRLGMALLPCGAVLALNVGIGLLTWGNIGGYGAAPIGYVPNLWDAFVEHTRPLLSPLSRLVFGETLAVAVALLVGACLLLGLLRYGRAQHRLLLVSAAWVLLTLLPVINLPVSALDLENNRLLYLASAGYCVVAAVLLHAWLDAARVWRPLWRTLARTSIALTLLLSMVACWLHLGPWLIATTQVSELNGELLHLIPPQTRPEPMIWHIENLPDNYRGAYIFRLGLGAARTFTAEPKDNSLLDLGRRAAEVPINRDSLDSFALRFDYDPKIGSSHVDYGIGITEGSSPPNKEADTGDNLMLWDFRSCEPYAISYWQVKQAQQSCQAGEGLTLQPSGEDPQITG